MRVPHFLGHILASFCMQQWWFFTNDIGDSNKRLKPNNIRSTFSNAGWNHIFFLYDFVYIVFFYQHTMHFSTAPPVRHPLPREPQGRIPSPMTRPEGVGSPCCCCPIPPGAPCWTNFQLAGKPLVISHSYGINSINGINWAIEIDVFQLLNMVMFHSYVE